MKKLLLIILLYLPAISYSQIIDDTVTIYIGDDKMVAPLPDSIDSYYNMLKVLVEMYNDLNLAYNALEGKFDEVIGGTLGYVESSNEVVEKMHETGQNIASDVTNVYFSGVQNERDRLKLGFGVNYNFLTLNNHAFSFTGLISRKRYYSQIGPIINLNFLGDKISWGFLLGFGIIF